MFLICDFMFQAFEPFDVIFQDCEPLQGASTTTYIITHIHTQKETNYCIQSHAQETPHTCDKLKAARAHTHKQSCTSTHEHRQEANVRLLFSLTERRNTKAVVVPTLRLLPNRSAERSVMRQYAFKKPCAVQLIQHV